MPGQAMHLTIVTCPVTAPGHCSGPRASRDCGHKQLWGWWGMCRAGCGREKAPPQGLTLTQDRLAFPLSGHWWGWRGSQQHHSEHSEHQRGAAWSQELGVTPAQQRPPHSLSTCPNPVHLLHPHVQVNWWSSPCPRAASQQPGHRPALPAPPEPAASSQSRTLGSPRPAGSLACSAGYATLQPGLGTPMPTPPGVAWNHSRVCGVLLNPGTRGHSGRGPSPLHSATPPSQPLAAGEQTAVAASRDPDRDPRCCRPPSHFRPHISALS